MARTPYIYPFQGIRVGNIIHFEGQVLHLSNSGYISNPEDSFWKNLKRTFQLYTPTKIKKSARNLEFVLNNTKYNTSLDKFGYFYLNVELNNTQQKALKEIRFYLGGDQIYINKEIGLSSLLLDKTNFEIGVISDIDDTIIVSHSTNKIKKTALVGLENAYSRKIVSETKDLFDFFESKNYQFFYVSNSETNLYLLIKWMLRINKLPKGPLFLKRIRSYRNIFKLKAKRSFEKKYRHKIGRIEDILENFPLKKFILVGDSSQGDPEIYSYISNIYPERIKAVFIRNISNNKRENMLKEFEKKHNELGILFKSYSEKNPINSFIKAKYF